MNHYEQKQQDRKEHYLEQAEKADDQSDALYKRSHDATAGIPFGQPILVGHHSEKRHRRALERSDNAMRKSIEADGKAKHYRGLAAGVGTGGISSDDPDAANKIQAKIDKAEANQKQMKACNKICRGPLDHQHKVHALSDELGIKQAAAIPMLEADCHGVVGFPAYMLANNNSNIRRMQQRLEELASKPNQNTEREQAGVKIIHNADENRIQLIFPGKPSEEVRKALKSSGFRWSRYFGAWQRQLTSNGIYAADIIISQLVAGNIK